MKTSTTPFKPVAARSIKTPAITAMALALLIFAWWQTGRWYHRTLLDSQRSEVAEGLAPYGNTITTALNERFALLVGLTAFVETELEDHGGVDPGQFETYASGLYHGAQGIRNFAVAPGGVQRYVFPLAGNESVPGHDLLNDPRTDVQADAQRAVESRQLTLSGPYELRQGGLGIVARQAIYRHGEFWGLATMVIDVPPIIEEAGLEAGNATLEFALRDSSGQVFLGVSSIFEQEPVVYLISLPEGSWELAAVPTGGWEAAVQPGLRSFQAVGIVITVLLTALFYSIASRQENLASTVAQRTQELRGEIEHRSHIEAELRDSEERYRMLFISNPHPMWVYDLETLAFLAVNEAAIAHYGYSEDEFMRRTIADIRPQEDVPALLDNVAHVSEGLDEAGLWRHIKKNGTVIAVDIISHTLDFGGRPAELVLALDVTERERQALLLRQNEARYRALFEQSPISLWEEDFSKVKPYVDSLTATGITDFQVYFRDHPEAVAECARLVRILDVNQASLNMHEASSKEQLYGGLDSILTDDSYGIFRDELIALAQGKLRFEGETIHRTLNGHTLHVALNLVVAPGYEGTWAKVFVSMRDMTRSRMAEEELRKLSRAVEQSASVVIITDLEGYIEYVNPKFTEVTGYTQQEIIGQTPRLLKSGTTPSEEYARLWATISAGGEWRGELQNKKKSGELYWIAASISPVKDSQGRITHYLGIQEDITENKRAEEALRQSEAQLRFITDHMLDMISQMGPDRLFLYASPSIKRWLGWEPEEVVGHSALEFVHPEDTDWLLALVRKAIANHESSLRAEYRFRCADGSYLWVETVINLLFDPANQFAGAIFSSRDVSERRQAQEALVQSEARFRSVFESAGVGISIADQEGKLVAVNPAFTHMVGYSQEELLGRSFASLTHPDDIDRDIQQSQRLRKREIDEFDLEKRYLHKDGSIVWAHLRVSRFPVHKHGVERTVAVIENITERKRGEEALRKYAQRLETLHEIDQAILEAHSPQETAEAALRYFKQLVSYRRASVMVLDAPAQELVLLAVDTHGSDASMGAGQHIPVATLGRQFEVLQTLAPYIVENVEELTDPPPVTRFLQQAGIRSFVNLPLKVQGELTGALNLASDTVGAFPLEVMEAAQELADQLAIAIQQAKLRAEVESYAAELEERVAHRTAELEAANEQLKALSQVKDEFVSNVSHELRTPISSIKLYHHLLTARPDRCSEYMAALERETERLKLLIEDLLSLSRLDQDRQDWNPVPVDLNRLCEWYITDRTPLAENHGLRLDFVSEPDLPTVPADEGLLGQVLSILLTNALSYTPAGGQIVVQTRQKQDAENSWVGFSVSDTGPGIAPEEQTRLFERFFRGAAGRASQVPGTGLGLALARAIMERHHGTIDLHSEGQPGKGCIFTVWLPGT